MNPAVSSCATMTPSELASTNDIKLGTTQRLKEARDRVYDIKANLDRLNEHFFGEPTSVKLDAEATCFNEEVENLAANLNRINLALADFMGNVMN